MDILTFFPNSLASRTKCVIVLTPVPSNKYGLRPTVPLKSFQITLLKPTAKISTSFLTTHLQFTIRDVYLCFMSLSGGYYKRLCKMTVPNLYNYSPQIEPWPHTVWMVLWFRFLLKSMVIRTQCNWQYRQTQTINTSIIVITNMVPKSTLKGLSLLIYVCIYINMYCHMNILPQCSILMELSNWVDVITCVAQRCF